MNSSPSDNHGRQPLYFRPRFAPGRNVRRSDWTGSVRLTLFLVVALILSLAWAYRTFAVPERPAPTPARPEIQFQNALPEERIDPALRA